MKNKLKIIKRNQFYFLNIFIFKYGETMTTLNQKTFKAFLHEIFTLPVWIKQIIYMELKEQLENSSIKSCIDTAKKDNCFQLYIPKLTYTGKKELGCKTKNLSENACIFLECVYQNTSIVEIAVKNDWNLCECSSYFLETMEAELVIKPSSRFVKGTALYMSGKIRLGEYFVKIDKITIEQLNEGLKKQKEIEETYGDRPGLAEILVSLNFLSKTDTEGILLLKEDCQKYYSSNLVTQNLHK